MVASSLMLQEANVSVIGSSEPAAFGDADPDAGALPGAEDDADGLEESPDLSDPQAASKPTISSSTSDSVHFLRMMFFDLPWYGCDKASKPLLLRAKSYNGRPEG